MIKRILVKIYSALARVWFYTRSFGHVKVKRKIAAVVSRSGGGAYSMKITSDLFLFTTYLVNSSLRQEFLRATMPTTLAGLSGEGFTARVVDASNKEYLAGNKEIFSQTSGVNLDFNADDKTMPAVYRDYLGAAKEDFFCMLFDDQPIIGLSKKWLAACADFLCDFKDKVPVILIENLSDCVVSEESGEVKCDLNNLEFKKKNIKPLGVVTYNGCSFAVMKNFHCGFFFNTMVGWCHDYARRMKWYTDNVSPDSPHKIERAALLYRGPIYQYIAVPLDVFMLDIDFAHTSDTRGVNPESKNLFEAMKKGFKIKYQI